ncbi:Tolloid-like protein 1 [Elysia marginata]|uniref:Tolloid-like protein 1 n=1 Tax=Elysia marginata TaxID=1093978 RepID=A0AAV4J4N4_9GAST|nr:Tolloid-like protein 1 [Elysia marginata]
MVLTSAYGEQLTGNAGAIQSPSYPEYYTNRAYNVWTITTNPGTRVRLTFDAFDLEDGGSGCVHDSLVIRDGRSKKAELLQRLCGSNILPLTVTATGNVMYLEFRSDHSVPRTGFSARWSTDCDDNLTGNTGTLLSINYPSNYPDNVRCVTTITTDPGTRVRLTFDTFDVQSGPVCNTSCPDDSLVIRNGNNHTARPLGRLCGDDLPLPVTTSGNVMYLEFTSQSSGVRPGYQARWTAVNVTEEREVFPNECQQVLGICAQTFSSPVNYTDGFCE